MACYLGRYSGFGLVFSDTQQLPLVLSPQFQYIIVIIQDAPAVADADVMDAKLLQFSVTREYLKSAS